MMKFTKRLFDNTSNKSCNFITNSFQLIFNQIQRTRIFFPNEFKIIWILSFGPIQNKIYCFVFMKLRQISFIRHISNISGLKPRIKLRICWIDNQFSNLDPTMLVFCFLLRFLIKKSEYEFRIKP